MSTPLTVQLAEAFGSKPVRKTLRQLVDEAVAEDASDDLERRLLDAFGPEAAELDRRAREVSGLDEVKFPAPTGDDGCLFAAPRAAMKLTTLRRLIGTAVYAGLLAPLIDAAINVASFPR